MNADFKITTTLLAWAIISIIFGIGLRIALSFTKTEITFGAFLIVVILSSFCALIPFIGQLLCVVVATYLLYKLTDLEAGNSLLVVALTRVIAMGLVLGVYVLLPHGPRTKEERMYQEMIEQIKNETNAVPLHPGTE